MRVDIVNSRLLNQQLSTKKFRRAEDVVKWFGAMQAQDYPGALWEVGLRLPGSKIGDVEKAVSGGRIIRTWPMRGTLHFVHAVDAKWMLQTLTPRVVRGLETYYAKMGLTTKVFEKSRDLVEKALEGGNQLTRPELYEILRKAIRVKEMRGYFILGYLAQKAFICFGPRRGKQQTFVLFDEWVKKSRKLSSAHALKEITKRYFQSHGPATLYDFAWWSGLPVGDAKKGIEAAGLLKEIISGKPYFFMRHSSPDLRLGAHLLPLYDEFLIAYKDRSASIDPAHAKEHFANKNGVYSPPLLIGGRVTGFWNRDMQKDRVVVRTRLFRRLNNVEKDAVNESVKRYGKFLGTSTELGR